MRLETDLLNDYNYLRVKTRQDSAQAASSVRQNSSPYSVNRSVFSENQSEHELFMQKWDKILRSGMGNQELTYLNEYATMMLPREDPAMKAVKRFQKAVFELTMVDKKVQAVGYRRYNRQVDKENKTNTQIREVINGQFKMLKDIKIQIIKPNVLV